MTEWYYADSSHQQQGPVTAQEICALYLKSVLHDQTMVWREGLDSWQPLESQKTALNLVTTPPPVTGGIDLRQDIHAIETGTAPLPGTHAGIYAQVATPSTVDTSYVVYAGFWKRVAAYLIDYIVLVIPGCIVGGITGLALGLLGGDSEATELLSSLISGLLGMVISLLYYAWFHASESGATLGKKAVGIKVVRLDGQRISFARAVGRYFATIISSLILCIGYLMAAFTERKQTLHDMICDTVVVDQWAFTENADQQNEQLGTVTVVTLVVGGLLIGLGILLLFGAMMAAIAAA